MKYEEKSVSCKRAFLSFLTLKCFDKKKNSKVKYRVVFIIIAHYKYSQAILHFIVILYGLTFFVV